ncbi:hypothetical protein [Clostridium botulinum]|uniref:hypothetical protein n=1 Tax=Clostridium botulinum TaxID=1491 RepID=UPI00059DF935|nr:hypothetical protein [Clostridium botulinum]KIN80967.1 hypothetical protein SD74_12190 [Clostridium botulinum]MCC5426879.1 hypothetical protein [Clostridium botulinum]
MDKTKIAKKIIRYRHHSATFYKLDKYLKITKLKIIKLELIESENGANLYNVVYKKGINLWNPFTWIIVLIPSFIISIWEAIKEVVEDMGSFKTDTFSESIKIKD